MISTSWLARPRSAAVVCALALMGVACSKGGDRQPEDAGADAAAAAELPPGTKACGHPAATPKQVVHEFLTASKERNVEGMLACFKPKHRERMATSAGRLIELTALSFTLGDERIDGDSASVAATVERYDGRGQVEIKHDPIRLERVDGAWYFR